MSREGQLLSDMWSVLRDECHKVVTEENYDVIQKAIKALEQKDTLEDIREELVALEEYYDKSEKLGRMFAIQRAIAIVDDFRGEEE